MRTTLMQLITSTSSFPTQESLEGLSSFIGQLRQQEKQIEDGIRGAIRRQAAHGRRAQADLSDAKLAVRELFERIKAIRSKAEQSEELVSDVCRDIKLWTSRSAI